MRSGVRSLSMDDADRNGGLRSEHTCRIGRHTAHRGWWARGAFSRCRSHRAHPRARHMAGHHRRAPRRPRHATQPSPQLPYHHRSPLCSTLSHHPSSSGRRSGSLAVALGGHLAPLTPPPPLLCPTHQLSSQIGARRGRLPPTRPSSPHTHTTHTYSCLHAQTHTHTHRQLPARPVLRSSDPQILRSGSGQSHQRAIKSPQVLKQPSRVLKSSRCHQDVLTRTPRRDCSMALGRRAGGGAW